MATPATPATPSVPPTVMEFRVGAITYRAVIVDERPRNARGKACDAITDFDAQEVRLFCGLRGQRRLNALLHELRHCWRRELPAPAGDEADADAAAHYAQAAMQDLERQGGLCALDGMVSEAEAQAIAREPEMVDDRADAPPLPDLEVAPAEAVSAADARPVGSLERVICPGCQHTYTAASVVTDPPTFSARDGLVVRRRLHCGFCGTLWEWWEGTKLDLVGPGASADQPRRVPNGVGLGEPVAITDPAAKLAFQREHPEAAYVLDY